MTDTTTTLLLGDCTERMRELADSSIDSIVCDPPYGLAFMGEEWDSFGSDTRQPGDVHYVTPDNPFGRGKVRYGYGPEFASSMRSFQSAMTSIFTEALRVARPGAHLLAFGGTRTYHRLACAIEDAGWKIRDCIMWVYGSGFPKSMDVAKAIDKVNGHTEAAAWNGWGTCLKPAVEPIVIARKLLEGTVAANVLKYGTGALNIDGCRVPTNDELSAHGDAQWRDEKSAKVYGSYKPAKRSQTDGQKIGRFPANLVHDGSDEVLALFPDSKGQCGAVKGNEPSELTRGIYGKFSGDRPPCSPRNDSGSAARFFYCAKASRSERGEGNLHPTVKPLALMRYLVRLVTRKGGLVLDPFMGSGTTGIAALQESMRFVGIERDADYMEIAKRRIAEAEAEIEQAREKERHEFIQQELPL